MLFLNLRNAKNNFNLKDFLQKPLTLMSGSGAQIRETNTESIAIGKAFDAIIYLDKISEINWAE